LIGGEAPVRGELAWLAVLDGPSADARGKIHKLAPDHTALGRHPSNQVVLADSTCSALHARIRVEASPEDGEPVFVLYDVGSANGTYVGDKQTYRDPSSRKYRHELKDGDYVLVGETTLVFKKV
jgi:pSer/pThr/pTyr-binding forkhead associated (FHA) protein